jgi:hypothetical protein
MHFPHIISDLQAYNGMQLARGQEKFVQEIAVESNAHWDVDSLNV